MALTKFLPTPYGVPATYHHVCEVIWDKTQPQMRVQLASYATADARTLQDGIPLGRINVSLPAGADLPGVADLYAAIKALPEWADAEDC